ncbi:unnamed protein product [Laminaria digitata]
MESRRTGDSSDNQDTRRAGRMTLGGIIYSWACWRPTPEIVGKLLRSMCTLTLESHESRAASGENATHSLSRVCVLLPPAVSLGTFNAAMCATLIPYKVSLTL